MFYKRPPSGGPPVIETMRQIKNKEPSGQPDGSLQEGRETGAWREDAG
jgi:hypothetical protein